MSLGTAAEDSCHRSPSSALEGCLAPLQSANRSLGWSQLVSGRSFAPTEIGQALEEAQCHRDKQGERDLFLVASREGKIFPGDRATNTFRAVLTIPSLGFPQLHHNTSQTHGSSSWIQGSSKAWPQLTCLTCHSSGSPLLSSFLLFLARFMVSQSSNLS